MANVETITDGIVSVQLDGTTDYDSSVSFPDGMPLASIDFVPSAATDKLTVRHKTATGPHLWLCLCTAITGYQRPFGPPPRVMFKPYIKASECTFGTVANARVVFILQPNPGR